MRLMGCQRLQSYSEFVCLFVCSFIRLFVGCFLYLDFVVHSFVGWLGSCGSGDLREQIHVDFKGMLNVMSKYISLFCLKPYK